MKKWTLDDFRETFFDMEQKLNLFSQQIAGVWFWKLVRADLNYLTRGYLITKELQTKQKPKYNVKERIEKFYGYNSSPLIYDGNIEYYILDRGKKHQYKNQLVDIFSYDIEQKIINEGCRYNIIDYPFFGDYFSEFDHVRKNIESMTYFSQRKNTKLNIKLTSEESRIIKVIEDEFYDRFKFDVNIILNLKNKIINEVKRFKKEYTYYKKLFLQTKPKKIYTTIYYRRHSAVAAAKDLGIEFADIQYANINVNHPALGFPNDTYIPYFPDEIIVWGDFFKDATPIPNNSTIKVNAPSYFTSVQEDYKHIEKEGNFITFASQYSIGELLFEIAYKFALKNPDFNVVFRLHPGELGKYENYELYNEAIQLQNFRLSSKDTEDLHELLAKSEYQVGVYSTTMIEGILHNVKSIFANLDGVEEFEFFFKNGHAPLINDEEELLDEIKSFNFENIDLQYFFNFQNKIEL